jgi:hypothetical protein
LMSADGIAQRDAVVLRPISWQDAPVLSRASW